jgi:ABC-type nickel/cobalt efflux system permease component RcnA
LIIAYVCILSLSHCKAQTWLDDITPPEPKTPKQNTNQLFGGFALQALGVGLCVGSGYLLVLYPEEMGEVAVYGLTAGTAMTVVGSGLIIRSVRNIVITRKAFHKMHKSRKQPEISIYFGTTKYGAGIVCTF